MTINDGNKTYRTGEIELLAPAKDLEGGIAAIDHGADAVYIGGPCFSARSMAANSLEDIALLIETAHKYHVRVYIAMNTTLTEQEVDRAVGIIYQLYELGADAVIIQDMGLLECDLPPIALHASTQMDIRTKEKVRLLEQLGFQQVVLARELSLKQIREIAALSSVTIECFVHGALCVSYSGQCYISEVMAGRSANRGECAQFCRHRFTLEDSEGKVVAADRHLLSLKDLNQIHNLESLVEAGVRSFKIEGRLKDSQYVKNITALYREKLDQLIGSRPDLRKSSSGQVSISFTPDPAKTFHRGQTEYFLHKRRSRPGGIFTPKSIGEKIGKVVSLGKNFITVDSSKELSNGDGLCFFDASLELIGFRLNKVSGERLYPAKMVRPAVGEIIYRNFDRLFHQQLEKSRGCRTISIRLSVREEDEGLSIGVQDEDGITSRVWRKLPSQCARKPELTHKSILRQVSRCGDTPFHLLAADIEVAESSYYQLSDIKALRREALDQHLERRLSRYTRVESKRPENAVVWPWGSLSYKDNVTNSRAERFYRKLGAHFSREKEPIDLMTCKYCIRAQLGLCLEDETSSQGYREPLFLKDKVATYRLVFDCRRCEMILRKKKST